MESERILQCLLKSRTTEGLKTTSLDVKNYLSASWESSESTAVRYAMKHSNFCLKLLRCCIEIMKEKETTMGNTEVIFDICKAGIHTLDVALTGLETKDRLSLATRLEKLVLHILLHAPKEKVYIDSFTYYSNTFQRVAKLERDLDPEAFEEKSSSFIKKAYDIHISLCGNLQKLGSIAESILIIMLGFKSLILCEKFFPLILGHLESIIAKSAFQKVTIKCDVFDHFLQASTALFLEAAKELSFQVSKISKQNCTDDLFVILFYLHEGFLNSVEPKLIKAVRDQLSTFLNVCNSHCIKSLVKYFIQTFDIKTAILDRKKCVCEQWKGLQQKFSKFETALSDLTDVTGKICRRTVLYILNAVRCLGSANDVVCPKFISWTFGLICSTLKKLFNGIEIYELLPKDAKIEIFRRQWQELFIWVDDTFQNLFQQTKICKSGNFNLEELRSIVSETFLIIGEATRELMTYDHFSEKCQRFDKKLLSSHLYNAGLLSYKAQSYVDSGRFLILATAWLKELCFDAAGRVRGNTVKEAKYVDKIKLLVDAFRRSEQVEPALEHTKDTLNLFLSTNDSFKESIVTLVELWVDIQFSTVVDNHSVVKELPIHYSPLSDAIHDGSDMGLTAVAMETEYDAITFYATSLDSHFYQSTMKKVLEGRLSFYEKENNVLGMVSTCLELVSLSSDVLEQNTRLDFCHQAIALLEEDLKNEGKATNKAQDLKAHFYFTMGMTKYRERIAAGKLALVLEERAKREKEDVPIFEGSFDSFGISELRCAQQLWNDLLSSSARGSDSAKDFRQELYSYKKTISSTLQMGLLFFLLKQEFEAIRSLRVCIRVCELAAHLPSWEELSDQLVTARLVMAKLLTDNCLFEQAFECVNLIHDSGDETDLPWVRKRIAKARILLTCRKNNDVQTLLEEIRGSKTLEGKTRSAFGVRADELLLRSQLSKVHSDGQSYEDDDSNTLELLLEALNILRNLSSISDGASNASNHIVLDSLLDCLLSIGQCYKNLGSPAEALYYLNEGADLANVYCIPARFLEFKLALVQLLTIAESREDTESELDAIQKILLHIGMKSSTNDVHSYSKQDPQLFNVGLQRCCIREIIVNVKKIDSHTLKRLESNFLEIQTAYSHAVELYLDSASTSCHEKPSKGGAKGRKKGSQNKHTVVREFPVLYPSDISLVRFFQESASFHTLKAESMSIEDSIAHIEEFLSSLSENAIVYNMLDKDCLNELYSFVVTKEFVQRDGDKSAPNNWKFANSINLPSNVQDKIEGKKAAKRGKKTANEGKQTRGKKRTTKKKDVAASKETTDNAVGPEVCNIDRVDNNSSSSDLQNKLTDLLANLGPDGNVILMKSALQLLSILTGRSDPERCAAYHNLSMAQSLHRQLLTSLRKKLRRMPKTIKEAESSAAKRELEDSSVKILEAANELQLYNTPGKNAQAHLQLVNKLPPDWRICSLSLVNAGHDRMLITRTQAGDKPLVFNLPLQDSSLDWSENEEDDCDSLVRGLASAFQSDPLEDFQDIMSCNLESMGSNDVKAWWQQRVHLDKRLEKFLLKLENKWLGCWKGVVLGQSEDIKREKRLLEIAENLAQEIADSYNCAVEKEYLQILLDSSSFLKSSQIEDAMKSILGTKFTSDAVEMFQEHAESLETTLQKSRGKKEQKRNTRRGPVILILDGGVDQLPWESIPILRCNPVCRMPSLVLTSLRARSMLPLIDEGLASDSAFYVLNPQQDLPNTQKMFEEQFEREPGWQGIVGRSPTEEEYTSALTNHGLFVYCGHGTGSQYMARGKIQKITCKATTLLMGCSSARLKTQGKYESYGMVLSYLLAECPAVVANLWDVTDKDIDRFLDRMLEVWKSSRHVALPNSVVAARPACRLPFLIGCSPVVYGLPINVKWK